MYNRIDNNTSDYVIDYLIVPTNFYDNNIKNNGQNLKTRHYEELKPFSTSLGLGFLIDIYEK